jgi:hypothetical protein
MLVCVDVRLLCKVCSCDKHVFASQKVKLVVTAIRFFLNENAAAEADSDEEEDNVLRGAEAAKSLHKYARTN